MINKSLVGHRSSPNPPTTYPSPTSITSAANIRVMAPPRLMVDPHIAETSGVDHPANGIEGWIAMKSKEEGISPEMAALFAKGEAAAMGIELTDGQVAEYLAKRDFTQAQRDEAEKKGHAMSGGAYLVNSVSDLENAVKAFGRAKDPEATKRHIIEQARRLGATSALPDEWGVTKNQGETMPLTDEIFKSLSPEVQAHVSALEESVNKATSLEETLTKAANGPHGFVADDDGDCEICNKSKSDGNHTDMSKSVDPNATDEELAAIAFEKALQDMPATVREFMKAQQRQAVEAKEMAKALFDERETSRFEEMTKSLSHLPGITVAGFAPVLRKAAEVSPESFEKIYEMFKAADSALEASGAFSEIGTGGTSEGTASGGAANLEGLAKALQKDNPEMSYEEALTKAVGEHPELYRAHRTEQNRLNAGLEG